jgi:hypothetical protein
MGGAMGESDKTPRRSAKKARCAIYTRKSSEEGLAQAFNSLDAQREACAAFILSQKHEGWTVLPGLYDGCLSRARTASCLVPPRVEPEGMVPGFADPFARLLARANLVFVGFLLCDIF